MARLLCCSRRNSSIEKDFGASHSATIYRALHPSRFAASRGVGHLGPKLRVVLLKSAYRRSETGLQSDHYDWPRGSRPTRVVRWVTFRNARLSFQVQRRWWEGCCRHLTSSFIRPWRSSGGGAGDGCSRSCANERTDAGRLLLIGEPGRSHVTFRSPVPSHHWRQEERHDQMVSTESD
jgi:hypothetical protein